MRGVSAGAAVEQPEIVGRRDALSSCDAAVARALSGRGGLQLIAGEPGIGKTTVLQAVAAAAVRQGCEVRWAACIEDDAVPAFWPMVRLLSEPADPSLGAVAAELTGDAGDAGQHRFVVFDRVATALRRAAERTPQLLILDDLHWADPSSLRLLGFLVKQVRTSRVLVLGSYRDTDVGPDHPLLQLLAEPGSSGETLTLTGLSVDAVAELVARAGGRSAGDSVSQIRDHTGGNPFFVLHVSRLLDAEGHFEAADNSLPLPVGVRAVLERRLARLSQPAADVLAVAAVIGARFDVNLLAEVSGRTAGAISDLLDESAGARLTQPHDDHHHEFVHALVRATARAQLSGERRAQVHAAIADALTSRSGDDEQRLAAIAHHELNAGPQRAAQRGVDAAERAGRHAAAARAFEQAADHYSRAIAACTDTQRLADLQLELGDARLRSGDWDAAAAAFGAAADLARQDGRADVLAAAALGIGADTGGFEVRLHDHAQLALLDEALAMVGDSDIALRSRLLARRSVAATNEATAQQRGADSDEAVRLARQAGDPRALAYALSAWCDANAAPEHTAARLEAAAEMLAAGEASGDREAVLTARRFRVVALLESGDPEVHAEIERFAGVAESLGQPLYRWYVPLFAGMQALLRGDLDEAERRANEAAALGEEAGSTNALMLANTQLAGIEFERGHLLYLVEMFERTLAEMPWMREQPIVVAMTPMIHLARGRTTEALQGLHGLAATGFAEVPRDSEWLSTLSGLSMGIFSTGDAVSAAALYDLLLPHAGAMIVDGIAATCLDSVDYLLGRLAATTGRREDAIRHLRAAVDQSQRLGAPLLQAHAEHALASELGTADPQAESLRKRSEAVIRAAGAAPVVMFGFAAEANAGAPPEAPPARRQGVFQRDGKTWTLTFENATARLNDAKGLHDLRHLLAHPNTPVPAAALQQSDGAPGGTPSRGADVLDDTARAAYRARLADLDADITEAEDANDLERAATAREEREFLLDELSAAVGLGGRSRRMGDDADRARKAVTMRIRNAIERIGREHPALGRHLELAVKTGSVCSYEPEQPVDWTV